MYNVYISKMDYGYPSVKISIRAVELEVPTSDFSSRQFQLSDSSSDLQLHY